MNEKVGIIISFPSRHEFAMWWTKARGEVQVEQVKTVYVIEQKGDEEGLFSVHKLGEDPASGSLLKRVPAAPEESAEQNGEETNV